ncbi:Complex 1 LYR [Apiospora marii]|uniref:Complex 1 LYR n=1 Tax=Apiospora marii TaxID=335849 RepID=A0ABR1SNH8_9PEZI
MSSHCIGSVSARLVQNQRSEMNKSIQIDKRDFAAIEFLLRKGRRQLEVYSAPGITDIHRSS